MKRIDWHAGFVSAMKLELIDNENDLEFKEEYPIANRAQRIDLLIIKNDRNVAIVNPIGAMFSRYNICEYKSPDQSLTYGDFFKVLAYTGLYLNETQPEHGYCAKDYTMTFIREPHPYRLFKRLSQDGINVSQVCPGIYRLSNNLPFATQVIVTKEIPDKQKSWLTCLTKHGNVGNLENIIDKTLSLDDYHKTYARNIMSVFNSANMSLVKEQIKEAGMYNSVNELFADEIKDLKAIVADKDSIISKLQAENSALIARLNAKTGKKTGKKSTVK